MTTNEALQKHKREEQEERRKNRSLLQRPRIMRNPLATGIGPRCESGLKTPLQIKDLRAQAFAQNLQRRVILDLADEGGMPHAGLAPFENGSGAEISSFEYDSATKGLVVGIHAAVDFLVSVLPNEEETQRDEGLRYSFHNLRPMMHFHSSLSSMALSNQRTLLSTTVGGASRPKIYITNLIDPTFAERSQPLDGHCAVSIAPPNVPTIWCSATNPNTLPSSSEPQRLAIGTSNGILIVQNERNMWRCSTPSEDLSDVLALDWLSPTLLAGGHRNRTITLYDARSQGSVNRFRHSGPVIALKRADNEHRLVVAGMDNEMGLYDLRMLNSTDSHDLNEQRIHDRIDRQTTREFQAYEHAEPWQLRRESQNHSRRQNTPTISYNQQSSEGSNNKRKTKKRKRTLPTTSTLPKRTTAVLKFPYENAYMYPLGLDVSAELGLVAGAEDDGSISIWSLRSGEKIRKLEMSNETERGCRRRGETEAVKCLRFGEDERGVARLLASRAGRIVEWAW